MLRDTFARWLALTLCLFALALLGASCTEASEPPPAGCPVALDWHDCALNFDADARCGATFPTSTACFFSPGTACGEGCGYPLQDSAYLSPVLCKGQGTVEWWCYRGLCPVKPP